MGRRTTASDIKAIVKRLRDRIPDICIRTTLIAGFPGETEEEHEETLAFVNEMEFERLGVFPYSQEEDTPAGKLECQIDDEVKEAVAAKDKEIMEV